MALGDTGLHGLPWRHFAGELLDVRVDSRWHMLPAKRMWGAVESSVVDKADVA